MFEGLEPICLIKVLSAILRQVTDNLYKSAAKLQKKIRMCK